MIGAKIKKFRFVLRKQWRFQFKNLASWQPHFFEIFSLSGGVSGKLIRDP